MTTLQMQFATHFQASVNEDPMELTSDIDQRTGTGDDIDIDLDLTGDNLQDGEDEFMGEEDMNVLADSTSADGQETHAANDDEMADEGYAHVQVDEGSSFRDEDIEDAGYTGPELDEDTIVDPDLGHPNEQFEELLTKFDEITDQDPEQDYQEQDHNGQEQHEQPATPETESGVFERGLPSGQSGLVNPNYGVTEAATQKTLDGYNFEVNRESKVTHGGPDQILEHSGVEGLNAPGAKLEQVAGDVLLASLDQGIPAQSNAEGSDAQKEDSLNSPAHLHPVVLDYQGDGMFLFPPVDQNGEHASTFLLPDEQLAYNTIEHLLEACRGVLKESLSVQDELVIDIDDLDLHISESSIESASTRLSEVVDLYVHLQHNDGLKNPPPLYMDLTSRNRFSRRVDVLRNALIEGKGLSQLKLFQETEDDQQHKTKRETDPSSHTAVLSSNPTYAPEQKPGEEAEEGIEQRDSQGGPQLSENTPLGTKSAARVTRSDLIADAAPEERGHTEPRPGSDSSPLEAGISHDFLSEAAGSEKFLGPLQPFTGELETQRVEESIVDDGDFIDYEDIEELDGGTSSASSTLQGDGIDVIAVQDHAVTEEQVLAQNQEHRSPHDVQENAAADERILHDFVDEKDTSDVGIPVEEEHPNFADILSQDSGDKSHSLSGQFNEEEEASENDRDASISQETGLRPNVNADADQHEAASAQHEDDSGFYRQDALHEHAAQTEGDAYTATGTKFNGELDEYSSTHPFQSESSGSGRSPRDDDQGRVRDVEVENELEEVDISIANDDNDHAPQLQDGVNTRPSFFVDESAQTQEDDDEITYEDEEDDTEFPLEPAMAKHNVATSPGSLKRARDLDEDDDALEEDLQGAKRVRSG